MHARNRPAADGAGTPLGPVDLGRRHALGALALFGVGACSGSGDGGSSYSSGGSGTGSTGSTGGTGSTTTSCVLIPEETVGPYPLWGTIAEAAVYQRQDIAEGRPGVPLTLKLRIVNVGNGCAAVTNAMVYVWHCDKDGLYSGYGAQAGDTFCRGVQSTDANGDVTFLTVYPGWYTGRITHVHFRVYLSNTLAATSQLCFPSSVTSAVYATSEYSGRGQNTSVTGFGSDNVFSDGTQYQMCTVEEDSATGGYVAMLTVGVVA